jgi:hypothetical protein
MTPIHVRVSNCMSIVNGDRELLFQLWKATKDLKRPYQIIEAPRTGDGSHYIIKDAT